jgi:hypothetical protein
VVLVSSVLICLVEAATLLRPAVRAWIEAER